jgi:hypothetical protein
MATKIRAEVISAVKLSAAVDRAVKIAAERHPVSAGDKNLLFNWELVGRLVREAKLAHSFSTEVAAEVSKATGLKVQPATFQIGKQILAGFIERARLPATRDLL